MLYFINMLAREKIGGDSFDVIKIGFSNNFNKRLCAYISHNTSFGVIKKLDGDKFNTGCESIIHSYLRDKRHNRRTEVFVRDLEIDQLIDNLNSVGDIVSLCSKIKKPKKNVRLYLKLYKPIILHNWSEISKVFSGKPEDIIISMLYYREMDIKKHVKDLFGIDLQDVPEEDLKELEDFFRGYNKLTDRNYKLKYLCDYCRKVGNTSILQFIEEKKFDVYINVFGLDVCKAVWYKTSELDRRLSVMSFDTSILSARILSEFNVGESHTNVYIKDRLKDIYKEIGYKVNAKATDLNNYFDTKKCLIQEGSKRVNGLKLISKKV
jgi:hypothetical protein